MKIIAACALLVAASTSAVVWWNLPADSTSKGESRAELPAPKQEDKKEPAQVKEKDEPKVIAEVVARVKPVPPTDPKAPSGEFPFPNDLLGQRLAKYLPPELATIKPVQRKPLTLPGPAWLEKPEAPLPA